MFITKYEQWALMKSNKWCTAIPLKICMGYLKLIIFDASVLLVLTVIISQHLLHTLPKVILKT